MSAPAWERGARVWYRPVLAGYGYDDGNIPAIVWRVTPARVRVEFLSHGGTGSRVVDVATTDTRLRPRHPDDRAAIDLVWESLTG